LKLQAFYYSNFVHRSSFFRFQEFIYNYQFKLAAGLSWQFLHLSEYCKFLQCLDVSH